MADLDLAYHRLHALAAQFDTVLQGHRTMLLTSQSVLLSVAAFVSQGRGGGVVSPWLPLTLFAMGMFLIALWIRVVIPGSHDVAFCQLQLLRLEHGERATMGDAFYTDLVRWQSTHGAEKIRCFRDDPLGPAAVAGKRVPATPELRLAFGVRHVLGVAAGVRLRSLNAACTNGPRARASSRR